MPTVEIEESTLRVLFSKVTTRPLHCDVQVPAAMEGEYNWLVYTGSEGEPKDPEYVAEFARKEDAEFFIGARQIIADLLALEG